IVTGLFTERNVNIQTQGPSRPPQRGGVGFTFTTSYNFLIYIFFIRIQEYFIFLIFPFWGQGVVPPFGVRGLSPLWGLGGQFLRILLYKRIPSTVTFSNGYTS